MTELARENPEPGTGQIQAWLVQKSTWDLRSLCAVLGLKGYRRKPKTYVIYLLLTRSVLVAGVFEKEKNQAIPIDENRLKFLIDHFSGLHSGRLFTQRLTETLKL